MYQMNEYEIVKVHLRGLQQTPFTYRGENSVLLGCLKKIFEFVSIREFSFPQKSSHLVGHEKGQNESSARKNFNFCETQIIFRYPSTIQLGTF